MAELHGIGVAAVFAADAELDAGAGLVALRRRDLDELADAGLVNRGERILLHDLVLRVGTEERTRVVTRHAEAGLREVVRAEAEEFRRLRDLVGGEGTAPDFHQCSYRRGKLYFPLLHP